MRKIILFTLICISIQGLFSEELVCPSYTKKDNVPEPSSAELPQGWYAFYFDSLPGLYISSIQNYDPFIVPNTTHDNPRLIDISENGKWMLYIDQNTCRVFVIRPDGHGKKEISVPYADSAFPKTAGFYHASPYSSEIFYMAEKAKMAALRVEFGETATVIGEHRLIADLGTQTWFAKGFSDQYTVWRDQIYGRLDRWYGGKYVGKTAFVTIPDSGRGIARYSNIYQWRNDQHTGRWGCGHTMSSNGEYTLANSALIGSACVPNRKNTPMMDHKGFYIAPFRCDGDSAIEIDDHIDAFGTSINWCPERLRFGSHTEVDFTSWHFSNNNDYVIGILGGSSTPYYGIWIIHWKTNAWTLVTPSDQTEKQYQDPALHFGPPVNRDALAEDTATILDPNPKAKGSKYRVLSPNGGETYHVGDTMQIEIFSKVNARATLALRIDRYLFPLPGFEADFNPKQRNIISFVIPPALMKSVWDDVNNTSKDSAFSTVSNKCKIRLQDYSEKTEYDESDDYFAIAPSIGILHPDGMFGNVSDRRLLSVVPAHIVRHISFPPSAKAARLYSLSGRFLGTITPGSGRMIKIPAHLGTEMIMVRYVY